MRCLKITLKIAALVILGFLIWIFCQSLPSRPVVSEAELIHSIGKTVLLEGVIESYKDGAFALLLNKTAIYIEGDGLSDLSNEMRVKMEGTLEVETNVVSEGQVQQMKQQLDKEPSIQMAMLVAGTNVFFVLKHSRIVKNND